MRCISDRDVFRSVVRREDDDDVIRHVSLIEVVEQSAYVTVRICRSCEVDGVGASVFSFQTHRDVTQIRFQLLLVRIERRVGVVQPDVQHERTVLVAIDETDRFIDYEFGGTRPERTDVIGQESEIRSVACVHTTFVDSIREGLGRAFAVSEMPFAIVTDAISTLLKQSRVGHCACVQPVGHAAAGVHVVSGEVAMHAVPGGELPGDDSGAAG